MFLPVPVAGLRTKRTEDRKGERQKSFIPHSSGGLGPLFRKLTLTFEPTRLQSWLGTGTTELVRLSSKKRQSSDVMLNTLVAFGKDAEYI